MDDKINCTVYIMTLNGADVLPRALESVRDFDDILVTDGNSTDGTQEIARRYGARVIKQVESDEPNIMIEDFAAVQNRCIKEAKYNWIFQLDMDESISKELVEEIKQITADPIKFYAYYAPRRMMYGDREIKYSADKNYKETGYEMKFFNRTSGCIMIKSPHHRLEFDQNKYPVGYLKNVFNAYFSIPKYNEGRYYPKRFMDMEIKELRKQSWPQFFYWTLLIRSLKTFKKLLRFMYLYARYGFKETLPPKIEFGKVQYSWLVMLGALKERITGKYKIR